MLLLHHQLSCVAAGTVHAISRGVAFLKDPKLQTHGGFFVARNRHAYPPVMCAHIMLRHWRL
jgi:hypothetical protein